MREESAEEVFGAPPSKEEKGTCDGNLETNCYPIIEKMIRFLHVNESIDK